MSIENQSMTHITYESIENSTRIMELETDLAIANELLDSADEIIGRTFPGMYKPKLGKLYKRKHFKVREARKYLTERGIFKY